ncbi:hypothetical protein PENSPDRAFT_445108 [Peniophora sp. CONT]|nr:hypothetical protein PENSPDRAFT_445108 [Peniophora sp. CONT]
MLMMRGCIDFCVDRNETFFPAASFPPHQISYADKPSARASAISFVALNQTIKPAPPHVYHTSLSRFNMDFTNDDQTRPSTPVNDDTPRGSQCHPPSSHASLARFQTEIYSSPDTPSGSQSSLARAPTEILSSSQQSQSSDGSTVIFVINPNAQTGFTGNQPATTTAGSTIQPTNDHTSVTAHQAGPSQPVRAYSSLYTPPNLNDEQLSALVLERQNEQEIMLRQLLEGRGIQIYSRHGETQATTLMRLAVQHIRSLEVTRANSTPSPMHGVHLRDLIPEPETQYLSPYAAVWHY